MVLSVTYNNGQYIIDDLSRCGSPPIGKGTSFKEALGDYFINNASNNNIIFEFDQESHEYIRHTMIDEYEKNR